MTARPRPPTVVPEPEPLGPSELLPGLVVDAPHRAPGRRFWRRLLRHRLAVISAVVLVLLAAACFAAPALAPYGPKNGGFARRRHTASAARTSMLARLVTERIVYP